jgi:SanA protein
MRFVRTVHFLGFLFTVLMFGFIVLIAPSIIMRIAMAPYLYADVMKVPSASAGVVLGASVVRGKPSPALEARVETASVLYKEDKVPVLLVTGAVEKNYDEITPMREYLENAGIPPQDIAADNSGFDTYSSVYRARNTFLTSSIIIVSQDFHLPRAVFIARAMHLQAYGVAAARGGRLYDYLREIPASWKALWDVLAHRLPDAETLLVPIVISGIAAR